MTVVPPLEGRCAWPMVMQDCVAWDDADPEVQEWAQSIATDLMWALSGRQFGVCTTLVRPLSCRPILVTDVGLFAVGAPLAESPCPPLCQAVRLPGPVLSVSEIIMDGVVQPDTLWYLSGDDLLRRDGDPWPLLQDLSLPTTEVGTWSVEYLRGIPVPVGGQTAAGTYACQLVRQITTGKCDLPERVTQIARQGVTMTMLDPMDFLNAGRTGLPSVDGWLASVNPNRMQEPSRVYSPDTPSVQRWAG